MKRLVVGWALALTCLAAPHAWAQYTSSLDPSLPNYSPTADRQSGVDFRTPRRPPDPSRVPGAVRPGPFTPVLPTTVVKYPPIPKVPVPKSAEAQFAQCAGNSADATADAMLAACSAMIDGGRENGGRLAEIYANRAKAWHANAQFNAAIGDFDQALRLAPQKVEALQGRCMSRAVVGQLLQALADCDQALKIRPDDIASLEARGFTHRKMRAFDRSIADYDAVLQREPKRAAALFGRGAARLDAGDQGGILDIKEAKLVQSDVAQQFARYGVYR
jgi:hypothetical protein